MNRRRSLIGPSSPPGSRGLKITPRQRDRKHSTTSNCLIFPETFQLPLARLPEEVGYGAEAPARCRRGPGRRLLEGHAGPEERVPARGCGHDGPRHHGPPDRAARARVNELRLTAYHEAGHAVACVVLRLAFKKVTIDEMDSSLGGVLVVTPPSVRWAFNSGVLTTAPRSARAVRARRWAERFLVVGYAGDAAVHRLTILHPPAEKVWPVSAATGTDAAWIQRCLTVLRVEPGRRQQYQERMIGEAVEIVSSHWQAVEALAVALIQRRTLNAGTARRIVREALA